MRKQTRNVVSINVRDSEESDEENLSSPSKGAGPRTSSTRNTLNVFLIAVIVISWLITSLLILLGSKSAQHRPISDISERMAQYERLVRHTSHLIQQYKQLSGSDKLPPDLTLPRKVSLMHDGRQDVEKSDSSDKPSRSKQSTSSSSTKPKSTTFPSTPRDLVIGLAEGISVDDVAIFVKSLRNVSSCAIMLFVPPGKGGDPYRGLASDYRVKLVAAKRDIYPQSVIHPLLQSPAALRWLYFRYFFSEQDGYRLIFHRAVVVDLSRGVAVLQDPFLTLSPQDDRLHVYPVAVQTSLSLSSSAISSPWKIDRHSAPMATRVRGAEEVLRTCMTRSTLSAQDLSLSSSVILGSMERIWRLIDVLGAVYTGEGSESASLSLFSAADRFHFPHCLSRLTSADKRQTLSALDDAVFSAVVNRHLLYGDDPVRQKRRSRSSEGEEEDVSPLVIHSGEDRLFVLSLRQIPSLSNSDVQEHIETATNNPNAVFTLLRQEGASVLLRYPLSPAVQSALHVIFLPNQHFSSRQWKISSHTGVAIESGLSLFTKKWAETRICVNNFVYSLDRDVFLGECDLSSKQVTSVTDCCALCRDKGDDCTSFTFLPHSLPQLPVSATEKSDLEIDKSRSETDMDSADDYIAVFAHGTSDRRSDTGSASQTGKDEDGLGAGVCFFKKCDKEKVQSLLQQQKQHPQERPGVVSAYRQDFSMET